MFWEVWHHRGEGQGRGTGARSLFAYIWRPTVFGGDAVCLLFGVRFLPDFSGFLCMTDFSGPVVRVGSGKDYLKDDF